MFLLISDFLMIDNKQSKKSSSPLGTYELLLAFIIIFVAIAYALINIYLYKQIDKSKQ